MATTAREFFEGLETRLDPSKTAGMTNSYVFEIDGAGTWKVDVQDGNVSVAEGGPPFASLRVYLVPAERERAEDLLRYARSPPAT